MQKAIDIKYDKMIGTLDIAELNEALSNGWKHVDSAPGYSGDILVIVERDEEGAKEA